MNQFANFDEGASGGSEGPWLQWVSKGTNDGEFPAKTFLIRDSEGEGDAKTFVRRNFDGFDRGVVLDIENMKTGWQFTAGVSGSAPEWVWGESIAEMPPKPDQVKKWKKGFEIQCAIGGGNTANWQQASAAAWSGFTALVPALRDGPNGKLPLVKYTGARFEKYSKGSTNIPILEVVKWVDRPDCLKPDAIDTGVAGTQEQAKTPDPAPVDEDMSF